MGESRQGKRKEAILGTAVFLVITLGFYFILFWKFTPIFGINDDWTVYMVLSGSYLGEPDPYVLFFLYPLAWLISTLYRITPAIPWYGLLLHGCFILSGFWLFYRFFMRMEGRVKKLLSGSFVLILYWISNLQVLIAIQYTHSAAICGAAAIFLFFTADTKEKDWKGFLWANLPTLLMVALAVCIRKNAAFMCLPIAGMLFLVKWWMEEKKITSESMKKYGGFAAALLLTMGVLLLSQEIAYSSPEWSEYAKVNYYREKVVDFYGTPGYEMMADVAEEIGMSEEQYNISCDVLNFYTGNIPYSQFLQIMMERSKAAYDKAHPFEQRFRQANQQMLDSLQTQELSPQNQIVILLAAGLLLLFVLSGESRGSVTLLAYLFGRFFAWYYILFNGRFPLRIPQCLLSIDVMVLLGIGLYFMGLLREQEGRKRRILQAATAVLAGLFFISSYKGIRKIDGSDDYVDIFQDRWYGVKEYCMNHPENMYLLNGGSQTLYYFSDNVLDTRTIGRSQNYYANSNFYSLSPNFYKKTGIEPGSDVAEALLEQENNYWIYEEGYFDQHRKTLDYYLNRYDTFTYELVDTFSTETSTFEVYRFSRQ
ncbi:MAG: hypothetical protein MR383_06615 [Lachnospiraceae bacterium]|nr:hypothetical protein [Lachnospiraceae bacterium]MDY5700259.1 hypothetical protein [Lachnospiraceae bacterium]